MYRSVGIGSRLRAGRSRNRGSIRDSGQRYFLFSSALTPAVGPTFTGINTPQQLEADCSHPSGVAIRLKV
jgi:hypothetical protein